MSSSSDGRLVKALRHVASGVLPVRAALIPGVHGECRIGIGILCDFIRPRTKARARGRTAVVDEGPLAVELTAGCLLPCQRVVRG